jgi:serine/threonine-protein kinase RsbW
VPARLFYLPAIGHFAKALFTRHPSLEACRDHQAYSLELTVYESCSNVIRHAYPDRDDGILQLKIWFASEKVVIEVIDYGPGFQPDLVPAPDLQNPRESGMGLFIIRSAVDRFDYTPSENERGNVLHLEKQL